MKGSRVGLARSFQPGDETPLPPSRSGEGQPAGRRRRVCDAYQSSAFVHFGGKEARPARDLFADAFTRLDAVMRLEPARIRRR